MIIPTFAQVTIHKKSDLKPREGNNTNLPSFEQTDTSKPDQSKLAWIIFGASVGAVVIIALVIWSQSIHKWFKRRAAERAQAHVEISSKASSEKVAVEEEKPQPAKKVARLREPKFTIVTLQTGNPAQPVTATAIPQIDPWYTRIFRGNRGHAASSSQSTGVRVDVTQIADVNGEVCTPARFSRFALGRGLVSPKSSDEESQKGAVPSLQQPKPFRITKSTLATPWEDLELERSLSGSTMTSHKAASKSKAPRRFR